MIDKPVLRNVANNKVVTIHTPVYKQWRYSEDSAQASTFFGVTFKI